MAHTAKFIKANIRAYYNRLTNHKYSKALKTKKNDVNILTYFDNPNRKLYCDHFTHIELKNDIRKEGQTFTLFYKTQRLGVLEVVQVQTFRLSQIPNITCFLNFGMSKYDLADEIRHEVLKGGYNPIDDEFQIVLFRYIERETASQPWLIHKLIR